MARSDRPPAFLRWMLVPLGLLDRALHRKPACLSVSFFTRPIAREISHVETRETGPSPQSARVCDRAAPSTDEEEEIRTGGCSDRAGPGRPWTAPAAYH